MKKLFILMVTLVGLAIIPLAVKAQNWEALRPVLQGLDSAQRADILGTLDTLKGSTATDSVRNGLRPNPAKLDSNAWAAARSLLAGKLGSSVHLSEGDVNAILARFDSVQTVFFLSADSLQMAAAAMPDSIGSVAALPSGVTPDSTLAQELRAEFAATPYREVKGNVPSLLRYYFSPSLSKLEAIASTQVVTELNFWGRKARDFMAVGVGIGNRPNYQQAFVPVWRIWGSFTLNPIDFGQGETAAKTEGFAPFQFAGYTGMLRTFAVLEKIRGFAGINVGFQTYAPAHADLRPSNVGFTTALTGSVTAGLVQTFGEDFIAKGSVTFEGGGIFNSPGYRFGGSHLDATVQKGKISVGYTYQPYASFAPNGQKSFTFHAAHVAWGLN